MSRGGVRSGNKRFERTSNGENLLRKDGLDGCSSLSICA